MWVNRQTGQTIQGTQAQRPQSSGDFNPLSGVRSGLGLGSTLANFSGLKGLGSGLGALGSVFGLGSGIANRNPAGIASNAGSLGLSAGKAGFLGGDVAKFLTGTPGAAFLAPSQGLANLGGLVGAGANQGLMGALGPIGAIAGVTSLLSGLLTSPAQNKVFTGNPFTGFMGTSGQLLKDIKAEGKIINKHRQEIGEFVAQGKPIPLEHLRVTGSSTADARGNPTGTSNHLPKLLAAYLNRGIDIPRGENGDYLVPAKVTAGNFREGMQSYHHSLDSPLLTTLVSIPEDEIDRKTDKVTGQIIYKVSGRESHGGRERDRRSETRNISRQD